MGEPSKATALESFRGAYIGLADRLVALTKIVTGIMVAVMLVDVNIAVIFRYAFHDPIFWADELAVSLMVWVSFLGAALAVASRMQYGFDGLVGLLPRAIRLPVIVFAQAGVALLLLVYVYMGFQALAPIKDQYLPSSGLTVVTVYAALPIGCVLMLIEQFAQYLRKPDEVAESGMGDVV